MPLDLRQLRYFVAIAEAGSLGAASATLRVAQSALSRQLQALEHACRGQLFERSARGVVPTEAGLLLLGRARYLLAEAARTQEEVAALNQEPGGLVRLAAASSFAGILYPVLAPAVLDRLPRVRLELREMLSDAALAGLRQGTLDLAVLSLRGNEPGIACATLCQEQMVLAGRPGDATLAGGRIALDALAALPLVLPVGVSWLDRVRRRLGPDAAALEARVQVDSAGSMKAMVLAGLGYGVVPYSAVRAEVAAGALSAAAIEGFTLDRLLAQAQDRPLGRATAAVAALVRDCTAQIVAAGGVTWPADGTGRRGPPRARRIPRAPRTG